MPSFLELKELE
jgi:hypothetical protein